MPYNHSDYLTYWTGSSSLSGERNDLTETRVISARPIIKHLRGEDIIFDSEGPTMIAGFDASFWLHGSNYDTDNLRVFLSASPGLYTTYLSATTSFDLFSTYPYLSSLYPAFTAFEIPKLEWPYAPNPYSAFGAERRINVGYYIDNPNTMRVNISAVSACHIDCGQIDIVVANKAGYATLQGSIVRVLP